MYSVLVLLSRCPSNSTRNSIKAAPSIPQLRALYRLVRKSKHIPGPAQNQLTLKQLLPRKNLKTWCETPPVMGASARRATSPSINDEFANPRQVCIRPSTQTQEGSPAWSPAPLGAHHHPRLRRPHRRPTNLRNHRLSTHVFDGAPIHASKMSANPHSLENWSITFYPLTPKLSSTRSGSIPHIVGLLTWFSTPPRRCSPVFCRWDLMVASHAHRCCLTRPRGLTGEQPRLSTHKQ